MRNFLIAEDEPVQRTMISNLVKRRFNAKVDQVENGKDALYMVKSSGNDYDIVILDINMPGMNGLDALDIIKQYSPTLPVIMLTGSENIEDAVRAMKVGAYDYVKKPLDPEHFCVSIKNALRLKDMGEELSRLKRNEEGVTKFSDIIGFDKGLKTTIELARKAASSEVPVMITGETGVGKELLAQAIHGESMRNGKPFIAVNCGAIPSQLVESTLFGHEKGAFTGAIARSLGKFREAGGGTLFLDEVGELPLETQVKLLRAIQQKEVEPVGAGKSVSVDVRIISATNRDIQKEVSLGNFREDLYFRLDVLPIHVPPLRNRKEDIKPLIEQFMNSYSVSNRADIKQISEQAMQALTQHNWQGNVRELKNKIERLMIITPENMIGVEDVNEVIGLTTEVITQNDTYSSFEKQEVKIEKNEKDFLFEEKDRLKTLEMIEKEAMQNALEFTNNNITKAAELLGIAKSTFYRKAKELGV